MFVSYSGHASLLAVPKSIISFTHAPLQASLFFNLVEGHIFYMMVPCFFSIHLFVLLLFDVSKINFHPVFSESSSRNSLASHHWLSLYLVLLLLLAGDAEINPGPVRIAFLFRSFI